MHSISPMRAVILVPLLVLAATLSACGDGPTELPHSTITSRSTGDATTQDMALDTYCDPDPTIGCTVVGGSPTPTDPSTCTSVTCTSTGGDGGYQGGGGGSGGGYEGSSTSVANTSTDFSPDTIKPNCANPGSGEEYEACNAPQPDADQWQKVRDSLNRIEMRSSSCAEIANKGRELLAAGKIRFFHHKAAYGDTAGWGNVGYGVLLEIEYWLFDHFTDKDRLGRNFDTGLAHEIEHAMGRTHIDTNGDGMITEMDFRTEHEMECTG